MQIRQLEMLVAVFEKNGYLNAGAHLHVSHSAVHRQIRLLEEEVGEKVFIRAGKKVQLTEAGKLLLELAGRFDREVFSVKQQISDLQDLVSGHLRIGTGTTALIYFLPPVLDQFRAAYPGVELHLATGTANQLIEDLQQGKLDLGLISEPLDGWTEKNLYYERLYREEFSLAVSKEHPLAARTSISWKELHDVPLIMFPAESRVRQFIDSLFVQAAVSPHILMELENEEAIEKFIEMGLGAGFIAKRRLARSTLHPLPIRRQTILLNVAGVRKDHHSPKRVLEFLRICREHAIRHRGNKIVF